MSEQDIRKEKFAELNNSDRIIGPFFGLILCIIWLAAIIFVEGRFFPGQNMANNLLISWINIGLIPFFVSAGNHLIYYRKFDGVEAARSMVALKCVLAGFGIWLVAIWLFLMESGISYMLVDAGGFIIIIVLILTFEWKVKRDCLNSEVRDHA